MTLRDAVTLWEMEHPTSKFMDEFVINAEVNKDSLFDYLMYEYEGMQIIDGHSGIFHDRVRMFFEIHKWNIDKLAESLQFEYDPLQNYRWKQHRDMDREQDVNSNTNRDVTTTTTEGIDTNTTGSWDEQGKDSGEDVNLVSAFNDLPSKDKPWVDTEHHRDIDDSKYSKDGSSTQTTHTDDVINTKTDDDTAKTENLDENVLEDITREGTNGVSYQELIEEERKQAEYNIYKWIGKHFCKELLVALW